MLLHATDRGQYDISKRTRVDHLYCVLARATAAHTPATMYAHAARLCRGQLIVANCIQVVSVHLAWLLLLMSWKLQSTVVRILDDVDRTKVIPCVEQYVSILCSTSILAFISA